MAAAKTTPAEPEAEQAAPPPAAVAFLAPAYEIPDRRNIHQRMVAIVAELPAIGKNQRNEQQGFNFRGSDDVLNELNPLLAKHGVYYLPEALERIYQERATAKGTIMHTVNLHVRFTFYGLLGDSVVASTWGEAMDTFDKATSKAHTMAMKYCLFEALCITVSEASDNDANTPEPTVSRRRSAASGSARGGSARGGSAPPPPPKAPDFVEDLGWPTKDEATAAHKRVADLLKDLGDDDRAVFDAWHAEHAPGWFWTAEDLALVEQHVEAIALGWDPDEGGGYGS